MGAPSFAFFAKGGIRSCVLQNLRLRRGAILLASLDPLRQGAIHQSAGLFDHGLGAAQLVVKSVCGRERDGGWAFSVLQSANCLQQALIRPIEAAVEAQPRLAHFHHIPAYGWVRRLPRIIITTIDGSMVDGQ